MEYRPIVAAQTQSHVVRHRDHGAVVQRILTSNRYVLSFGLLFVTIVPFCALWWVAAIRGKVLADFNFIPTYSAACLAMCLGHFSQRRIGSLPLVSGGSLIFPTFVATYGFVFFGLYILRQSTSVVHLGASFVAANIWYLATSVLRNRMIRPMIGLVGFDSRLLATLPERVDWICLTHPQRPKGVTAIAYDPHEPISMRWSTFITRMVLQGVPVYHLSHITEGLTGKVTFNDHSENDFGALLPSLFYLRIKRLLDVIIAILALPLVVLVLLTAAVAIKLESPGPAIFKQVRMGHRGKPFVCLKLRTMRTDVTGPAYTSEQDPRITRLGQYLRKWRIDELPQVFNVIWGEMSWIGPRPEAISLARDYARHVPFYNYRHAVRPGITGWAAVHQGNVALVEAAQEKLEYDFYYIRYFSFWLDTLIVLKTVLTVLTGFGSR